MIAIVMLKFTQSLRHTQLQCRELNTCMASKDKQKVVALFLEIVNFLITNCKLIVNDRWALFSHIMW